MNCCQQVGQLLHAHTNHGEGGRRHGRSPIYAINPNATGDLTPPNDETANSSLAWWQPRDGSYMPTPLVKDRRLYTCNDNGRLDVRDAMTGNLIYRQRVGTSSHTYSASAVAAGGHIYFVSAKVKSP